MIHYMTTIGVGGAWVGNELRILSRHGIPFTLHALRRPSETFFASEDVAEMNRKTRSLYPVSKLAVLRDVILAPLRFGPAFFAALWNALTGPRESFRIRLVALWHLFLACHWAAGLRGETVSHIHSQWIHSGGTVAMYGAWLLGKPFSFTGHAADLFRNRAALGDKIRRADFIVCISEFHRQFFLDNGARPEQLIKVYCGIDTSHFTPSRPVRAEGEPYRILSSGRLVEKKGFDVLIRACAVLKSRGFSFHCTIGGSGPLEQDLREQIAAADLGAEVTLTGSAINQEDLPDFMGSGHVYCLPCVWAADNDVDGLPMMLMEAMACGLPAVSTRLVGIPDLVKDGETGLLVAPEDETELADALERLANDPGLSDRLADAGRAHVMAQFDEQTCLEPLLEKYRAALARPVPQGEHSAA